MKMLNSINASISPQGIPLVTGPQLDVVPLITTFEPGTSDSFQLTSLSSYLVLLHQFVYEDLLQHTAKSLTKVKMSNIHYSPLILQSSYLVLGRYWIS